MQRACDGGCTTRFEFPCSSETKKENVRRRRNCCNPFWSDISWWSLAIVDPQTKCTNMDKIVGFCHCGNLACKHLWNTRKLWNNIFSVFFLFASKCAIDTCFAINLVQKDDLGFLGAKEGSGRKLPVSPSKLFTWVDSANFWLNFEARIPWFQPKALDCTGVQAISANWHAKTQETSKHSTEKRK